MLNPFLRTVFGVTLGWYFPPSSLWKKNPAFSARGFSSVTQPVNQVLHTSLESTNSLEAGLERILRGCSLAFGTCYINTSSRSRGVDYMPILQTWRLVSGGHFPPFFNVSEPRSLIQILFLRKENHHLKIVGAQLKSSCTFAPLGTIQGTVPECFCSCSEKCQA